MVRLVQIPTLRAVALAALEQNMLTPYAYDGFLQWIDRMEEQSLKPTDDWAIRQASEMMIRRRRAASVV
ncbi:hypothetical protein [Cohnella caldifontis]|uniref:hypothetical protein n=1 Tax=Cohnella caldifontis TaxID=3027471 RepID=UPI0023ED41FD|nr:hypothetical protein [Cohnella sp. YIM B05605]